VDDLKFDVAFSYAREDAWIAKDLCNLIEQSGLSVYSYENMPDKAGGPLRARLLEIYRDSGLNVLLWSRFYNSSSLESALSMERRCIVHRQRLSGLTHGCADAA